MSTIVTRSGRSRCCAALRRGTGRNTHLTAAELFVHGLPIDWTAVISQGRRVELPTYAFQHQRYWLEEAEAPASGPLVVDEVESRFWSAMERQDDELTTTLALDSHAVISSPPWARCSPPCRHGVASAAGSPPWTRGGTASGGSRSPTNRRQ